MSVELSFASGCLGKWGLFADCLAIDFAGRDMHWLTQLLKRPPSASAWLLCSIQFDTETWTLAKRRRDSLEWRNADGDTLRACVDTNPPALLAGLLGADALRAFYREEAIRRGGGLVCAEIVQAGEIRAVKVIIRYIVVLRTHTTGH